MTTRPEALRRALAETIAAALAHGPAAEPVRLRLTHAAAHPEPWPADCRLAGDVLAHWAAAPPAAAGRWRAVAVVVRDLLEAG